jgi:hypothetical protein
MPLVGGFFFFSVRAPAMAFFSFQAVAERKLALRMHLAALLTDKLSVMVFVPSSPIHFVAWPKSEPASAPGFIHYVHALCILFYYFLFCCFPIFSTRLQCMLLPETLNGTN